MVSGEMTTALAADLASVMVALQHLLAPLFVLGTLSNDLMLGSDSAFPIRSSVGVFSHVGYTALPRAKRVAILGVAPSKRAIVMLGAIITSQTAFASLPSAATLSPKRGRGKVTGTSTEAASINVFAKFGGDYLKSVAAMFANAFNAIALVGTVAGMRAKLSVVLLSLKKKFAMTTSRGACLNLCSPIAGGRTKSTIAGGVRGKSVATGFASGGRAFVLAGKGALTRTVFGIYRGVGVELFLANGASTNKGHIGVLSAKNIQQVWVGA